MKKFNIQVTQMVEVILDETKFTEKMMEDFRSSFFEFYEVEEHAEHLAQLFARGIYEQGDFIEGYGPSDDFGITFSISDVYTEIEDSEII